MQARQLRQTSCGCLLPRPISCCGVLGAPADGIDTIMDKRMTCRGCDRGEQRRRYDQRKKEVSRQHEITLVVLDYRMFECNGQKATAAEQRRGSSRDPGNTQQDC
jgi:hypothetical protein